MDSLTISDLEAATGVPRRTIYFYVQQGILPPPSGAGLAARYHQPHLLRLRAIPRLRRSGWRLDRIRHFFQTTSEAEIARLLDGEEPVLQTPPTSDAVPSVNQGAGPGARQSPVGSDGSAAPVRPDRQALTAERLQRWVARLHGLPTDVSAVMQPATPLVCYHLAPGVDLLASTDLSPRLTRAVAQLLDAAVAIFGTLNDEGPAEATGADGR